MLNQTEPNSLNVRKFYETLARIIGDREGVEIKVVAIREREPDEAGQLSQHTA
ncbi:hypothetical protein KIAC18_000248 [Sporomusa sphaeroides]|uniref:hypothetical protein n=1 Tax=Sporomusa sphaeroides TaxID=47679 RepID=UPI003DA04E6F